jgi:toxin-antitoxin system PIN domain toxin
MRAMLAPDVNVLVYAHREELPEHGTCKTWLDYTLGADAAFGIFDTVLASFVRIVTHPRVFKTPSPLDLALTFANGLRDHPNCVLVQPGSRHWAIFERLCRETGARGNIVADAYLAALAVESGCEWVTTDRDYSRFAGLRWRSPLD